MPRNVLPQRRACETFNVAFWNQQFLVSVGYYDNGKPGEIFVSSVRQSGTDLDAMCRDGAILLSLCLQHGVALDTIRNALTRNPNGSPMTLIGQITESMQPPQPPAEAVP